MGKTNRLFLCAMAFGVLGLSLLITLACQNATIEDAELDVDRNPKVSTGSRITYPKSGDDTDDGGSTYSGWTCFMGNAQHTGLSPYVGPGEEIELKWRRRDDSFYPYSTVVVGSDGTLYTVSDRGLHALNPDTGDDLWVTSLDDNMGVGMPCLSADGTVIYVTDSLMNLYAVSLSTHEILWTFSDADPAPFHYSSPMVDGLGVIYIGSEDGTFFAINSDGSKKWEFDAGGPIRSTPAIAPSGMLIFGSNDNYVYGVKTDGSLGWKYKTDDDVRGSACVGNNSIAYIGSEDGFCYAINAGNLVWTTELDIFGCTGCPAFSPDYQIVYFGSFMDELYAILVSTGVKKWTYVNRDLGGLYYSSPIVDRNGIIYGGLDNGDVIALNPDTGIEIWNYNVGGGVDCVPTIAKNGYLIISDSDYDLNALGAP